MKQPLVLTFDMGTQSARAMLVNTRGEILHKAQKVYEKPYNSPSPGWAEQDAGFYWQAICEVSLALKGKAGSLWEDMTAVSITTIRDSCLCLDKNNKPLREVILWLDNREAADIKAIPPVSSFMFQLARMADTVELQRKVSACNWIARYQPDIWEKTDKFVFISAWLIWKLCGRLADSTASIIGHIPFDSKTRSWMKQSDMRRKIFDVEDRMLCELVEPGEILGTISGAAAEETGIPKGVELVATGSDKGCETLGLSCLTPDKAAISFGTTATIQVTTTDYVEPLPFIPPYPAVIKGYYNPELEIYRGYWLISWFKREFAAKELIQAEELGVSAEELLNRRLEEIPPGCDGLIMQPYFTPGLVMPHAKGAVIGFSDVHTRIHIYRAIVEGINFSLMEGLYGIEKRGRFKVGGIYVAGGGSQSDEICQITASMFGLPVYRTQSHEVSGIGSSLAAFVAKGCFSDYNQAVGEMVHIKDSFLPDKSHTAVYKELYERVFVKVFDRLSPLYREINEITGGIV